MVDGDRISREQLSRRAERDEPLVDTPVINSLIEADMPLRGDIRQRVLVRLRENIRQRRTVGGISERIASNAVAPINNAIRTEAEERVRSRVQEGLTNQMGQGDR